MFGDGLSLSREAFRLRTSTGAAQSLLAAALFCVSGAASADSLTLSLGGEYTTGDYGGDSDIKDVYVPVTAAYGAGHFWGRLTVPYAYVDAPEGTVIQGGQVVPGTGNNITEGGIGDVILGLTYRDLWTSADRNSGLDLTSKIKFGTADQDKGLGSGENDYSLQLDGYTFIDALSLYATAGYKWRGNTDGFESQDDWFAGAGGSYRIVPRTRIGMAVSYRPDPVEGGNDDATDLTVYVTRLAGKSWWVEGYALTGLSDGSPDWGVGGSVTFELMRR
jgi:hypothetical protein